MTYEWKHAKTGEIYESPLYNIPPDDSGDWYRVYSFGLGPIVGAGGSPARSVRASKKG